MSAAAAVRHRSSMPPSSIAMPHRTRQQELDEAELEAQAEGRATACGAQVAARATHETAAGAGAGCAPSSPSPAPSASPSPPLSPASDEHYITATLQQLNYTHNASFAPGAMARARLQASCDAPAGYAHPSIQVHGVHGVDPSTDSRATIEAKLEKIDQARKMEKRRMEREAAATAAAGGAGAGAGIVRAPSRGAGTPPPQNGTAAGAADDVSAPNDAADEAVLRMLALRKLQLLQQHLRCDNRPIEVLPPTSTHGSVFLGSVGASHHLPNLLSAGVTHILSVGRNLAQPFPQHFQYLYIPMLDSSTTRITRDVYEACWEFIERGRTGRERRSMPLEPKRRATPSEQEVEVRETMGAAVAAATAASAVSPPSSSSSNPPLSVHARSSAGTHGPAAAVRAALASSESEEGRVLQARAHHGGARPGGAGGVVSSSSPSHSPRRGNVLVHCFAGKSRSTTILLSYLMYELQWDLEHSFQHVKKCRPSVNPNPGFLGQLKELERKLAEERMEPTETEPEPALSADEHTAATASTEPKENQPTMTVAASSTDAPMSPDGGAAPASVAPTAAAAAATGAAPTAKSNHA